MNRTRIEYCDFTWNPVTGCLHGCPYCFARRIAERFKDRSPEAARRAEEYAKAGIYLLTQLGKHPFPQGFMPTMHPNRLDEPLSRRKPARIFVCDMGDLFGDWVPEDWIEEVLDVVRECPQHTFLLLTKNPWRYAEFDLPPNVWAGTSIEDQKTADKRIPALLQTKAQVRWLSVEPLLGPIDLGLFGMLPGETRQIASRAYVHNYTSVWTLLSWIVVGAQTGPGAVKPEPEWVESIIQACRAADVPLFLKDNLHWPESIKQYPKEHTRYA